MRRLQNRKRLHMSQSSSTSCASDVSLIGHRPQSPLNTNSQEYINSYQFIFPKKKFKSLFDNHILQLFNDLKRINARVSHIY